MVIIDISTLNKVQVVKLSGELDASSSPEVVEKVQPITAVDPHLVIDMSGVSYMSSAGLRMLLTLYRAISGQGGKVVLVGLSIELEDTMSMTGFLDFFEHYPGLQDGVTAVVEGI